MIAPRDFITELKPDAGRWVGILAFCLFALLAGASMVKEGEWFIGPIIILWGLLGGGVSLGVLFSKRLTLRLTPQGFGYGTLRKKYFYRWDDIGVFGVANFGRRMVCFNLRAHVEDDKKVHTINRRNFGFDRFLPETYGKKPTELARLLEDWRYRYSDVKATESGCE